MVAKMQTKKIVAITGTSKYISAEKIQDLIVKEPTLDKHIKN